MHMSKVSQLPESDAFHALALMHCSGRYLDSLGIDDHLGNVLVHNFHLHTVLMSFVRQSKK
eukprot:scaffold57021_cov42-Prasinocladus_malaysianus.AAC.2